MSFNFKISLKTLKTILVSIYLFCSFKSIGRDSTLVNTIILKGLDKTSIDAFNNIYISDSAGQIYKFDPKGQLITQNQTFKTRALNLLEANNTVRIYCFYKDLQCFSFTDRQLSFFDLIYLDNEKFNFISLATVSSDNSLWLFDEAQMILYKYDPITQTVFQKNYLNQTLTNFEDFQFSYMHEYANNLYMIDNQKGIFIFDNMGNFKNFIKIPDCNYISFFKNLIYIFTNTQWGYCDLNLFYKYNDLNVIWNKGNITSKFIKTDRYLYILKPSQIQIFEFK
ncbi:MAG: hypothetical protein U0V72_06025 [Cytophagales bacterium]